MLYAYTSQRALRRAFWQQHPALPRRRITNYAGTGKMYPTDTRCAWCDWLNAQNIDPGLKNRATLTP